MRLGSKASTAAAAGLLGIACSGTPAGRAPGRATLPRHVIVLCVDALRADHVSAYGYVRRTTPTMDTLAVRGVLFERAAAQSNWTVPATAMLSDTPMTPSSRPYI